MHPWQAWIRQKKDKKKSHARLAFGPQDTNKSKQRTTRSQKTLYKTENYFRFFKREDSAQIWQIKKSRSVLIWIIQIADIKKEIKQDMEESIQENTKFLQDEGKKERFIIKNQLWVKFSVIFRFKTIFPLHVYHILNTCISYMYP